MGMKHQVYMATSDDGIVGIDHQWLGGQRVVQQAARLVSLLKGFVEAANDPLKEMTKERGLEMLKAVYSAIPEERYYHRVVEIEDTSDPTRKANDSGITLFDFRDPENPTYCFMKIAGDNTGRFIPIQGSDYDKDAVGLPDAKLMELDAVFQIFPTLETAVQEMISEE